MLDDIGLNNLVAYLHRLVWEFRRLYAPYFTTPTPLYSLYFAETEIGEARDAWLRQNTGDTFNRATDRRRDVQLELGQALMMVLTAFQDSVPEGRTTREIPSISRVAIAISSAVGVMDGTIELDDWPDAWELYAWDAIVVLVELLDNPIDTLQDVLAQIYTQRVAPKLPQKS